MRQMNINNTIKKMGFTPSELSKIRQMNINNTIKKMGFTPSELSKMRQMNINNTIKKIGLTPSTINSFTLPNAKLFTVMHDSYIKIKESKEKSVPCIDKLQKHNWMFPLTSILNANFINKITSLPDNQIEQFMLHHYTKNDFQSVKDTFEDILHNFDSINDDKKQGYKKMFHSMLKAFSNDSEAYILCIPCLFVALEHLNFIGKEFQIYKKDPNHKKIVNHQYFSDKLDEIRKTFKDGIHEDKSYNQLVSYNAYPIAKRFYLNFNQGKEINLNRNFLDHGKADLDSYSISDFIKLLTLCDAFTVLVS